VRIEDRMGLEVNPNLVRSVSRSLSLSLLVLPKPKREVVCLAYLLARLGDTLTDAGRWSTADRLKWLAALESAVLSKKPEVWRFDGSVGSALASEAELVLSATNLLELYSRLDSRSHLHTDELLKTLFSAMRWDLNTFQSSSSSSAVWGCRDEATFDWYCVSIAGCVGRFWVQTFELDSSFEILAVEYGKALQRINILRDVREDWQRGRAYLPRSLFSQLDLVKAPWEQVGWRSFVEPYIQKTRGMLQIGANFCDAIPYGSFRLRYASLLPLAIGWQTMIKLEKQVFWRQPQKVSRDEMRTILMRSVLDVALHRKVSARYRV
jgi:farnesyl-diphosphate farnesyltransferase